MIAALAFAPFSKASRDRLERNYRLRERAPAAASNRVNAGTVVPMFASITVDRTDDTAAASACTAAVNDCSLRGAVSFANANPGTTIVVPAGTYNLAIAGGAPEGRPGLWSGAGVGEAAETGGNDGPGAHGLPGTHGGWGGGG